jgi:hypothetical protein
MVMGIETSPCGVSPLKPRPWPVGQWGVECRLLLIPCCRLHVIHCKQELLCCDRRTATAGRAIWRLTRANEQCANRRCGALILRLGLGGSRRRTESGPVSGDGADSLRVVLNSSSSPVSCAWVSGESMRVVLNSSSSSGPFSTLGFII